METDIQPWWIQCEYCQQYKPDVQERACGYSLEIYDTIAMEIVCDDCEQGHRDDI